MGRGGDSTRVAANKGGGLRPHPLLKQRGGAEKASAFPQQAMCETPSSPKPHQQSDANWALLERAERDAGRPLEISSFSILKKLGTGSSATVYLVKLKNAPETDAKFALKVFHEKDFARKNRLRRVMTEHSILCSTDHPFVVTLYRTFKEAGTGAVAFLMDHCEHGDMYQILQRSVHGRFTEHQAKIYAAQVVIALQYLHVQGYVYRDLKPENILVCADGHVKLTDFDLSRAVEPPSPNVHLNASSDSSDDGGAYGALSLSGSSASLSPGQTQRDGTRPKSKGTLKRVRSKEDLLKMQRDDLRPVAVPRLRTTSFVGTDEYIAPEVITCRGYTSSVDWWSVGIFLYEMVYGCTPFVSKNRNECFKKIIEQDLRFPSSPQVSQTCKDLIRQLLVKDAMERLGSTYGAMELMSHPFFDNVQWALLRYNKQGE